jgi:hypothetical protein
MAGSGYEDEGTDDHEALISLGPCVWWLWRSVISETCYVIPDRLGGR